MRFENLPDDFDHMAEALHLPVASASLPCVNRSADVNRIRDDLRNDARLRAWVENRFKEDMIIFGYE